MWVQETVKTENQPGPGEEALPEATVKLRAGGVRYVVAGEVNGPVNALDHALRSAIGQAYPDAASYTHHRATETVLNLVCTLLPQQQNQHHKHVTPTDKLFLHKTLKTTDKLHPHTSTSNSNYLIPQTRYTHIQALPTQTT